VKPKWAELKGEAVLAENAALPAGSQLRLTLQDLTPGVAKDASVTTQTTPAGAVVPLPIALKYNETLIDPGRSYGLSAAILDARGRTTWETPIPVRVLTRGFEGKVRLSLRRVTSTGPAARALTTWEPPSRVRGRTRGCKGKVRLSLRRLTATAPPAVIPMTIDCGE